MRHPQPFHDPYAARDLNQRVQRWCDMCRESFIGTRVEKFCPKCRVSPEYAERKARMDARYREKRKRKIA